MRSPTILLPLLLALALPVTALAQQSPAAAPVPNPAAPLYRQTGEQYRVYEFPGTSEPIPYRLFVPESWTPGQRLPILITLRAGTSINNNHRDGNDLVRAARAHGYILISPLGYRGYQQPYYGSPYPVIRPDGPSVPGRGWSAEEDKRAEQDVLNVLSLVAAEYGADTARVFIHGQNPSGSAALNFVANYPQTFKAAVISSGPIVTDSYPFANLAGKVALLILHGENDSNNAIAASQAMAKTFQAQGVETLFLPVPGGEHLNAFLLAAEQIYAFLDAH